MREEVEPLDFVLESPYDVRDANRNKLVRPLQAEVRKRKLWACHLGPELGGQGYGQVKLALMNEKLGRNHVSHPPCSAARRRTPAMARFSPSTARPSRKSAISKPLLANDPIPSHVSR